jgi:hypothetical protein
MFFLRAWKLGELEQTAAMYGTSPQEIPAIRDDTANVRTDEREFKTPYLKRLWKRGKV